MDYTVDGRNKIQSHEYRLRYWIVPTGEEDSHKFLIIIIIRNSIQWKYSWMAGLDFVKTRNLYFIKLIGLWGIQPYAPLRVLK